MLGSTPADERPSWPVTEHLLSVVVSTRFGLYVAPFADLAYPHALVELGQSAERSGFEGIFLWDHVLRPQPALAIADPWVALAALACATSSVKLGALVTPLTRRRPQKLAREVVTLDHLSGGRVVVGAGLGVDTGGELSRFGEEVEPRVRADRPRVPEPPRPSSAR